MPTTMRNSWVLCKAHCGCEKCKKTLGCWKAKARRHGANASSLKYVLMCLTNDKTDMVRLEEETRSLPELPIHEKRGEAVWKKCGICTEKITYGGEHNTCVFPCGHTTCVSCYNNPLFREKAECPYCRKPIEKAYGLWGDETDETPTDEEETPEPEPTTEQANKIKEYENQIKEKNKQLHQLINILKKKKKPEPEEILDEIVWVGTLIKN